ncbi:MAG TPA: hypothetical protein VKM93_08630 [Terriglobia bacterium]|nr:hypothetical protein [Terriglobia bacterium]
MGRSNPADEAPAATGPAASTQHQREARNLIEQSRQLLDRMHPEDAEEAIELHAKIDAAIASDDQQALAQGIKALRELLFFVEGS